MPRAALDAKLGTHHLSARRSRSSFFLPSYEKAGSSRAFSS
jgi:hypothetical protein